MTFVPNTAPLNKKLVDYPFNRNNLAVHIKGDDPSYAITRDVFKQLTEWAYELAGDLGDTPFYTYDPGVCFESETLLIQRLGEGSEEWVLVWRDFAICWYKHPRRALITNRLLGDEEAKQFLSGCAGQLQESLLATFITNQRERPRYPRTPAEDHRILCIGKLVHGLYSGIGFKLLPEKDTE